MIQIIIAIILIVITIILDNNFFNINVDKFIVDNKIDKHNKITIWIYIPDKLNGLTELCIESIQRHLSNNYNVIIFAKNKIKDILPEYKEHFDKTKSEYMFMNLLKYSIIYKYGGIWFPCTTIVLDRFFLDEKIYLNGKLIFFKEKELEHNKYFNKFDFSAIASVKNTAQVKYILDKLLEKLQTFNYSFKFNNMTESYLDDDSNIHYLPISSYSSINNFFLNNNDLIDTHPVIKLNKDIKLIFLDIKKFKDTPNFRYILTANKKNIMTSKLFLKSLFEYSDQK